MLLIEETARNPAEPEKPQEFTGELFWYDFNRAYRWIVRSWSEVNLDFALPRELNMLEGINQRLGAGFPENIKPL